jgi:hypothetical protein
MRRIVVIPPFLAITSTELGSHGSPSECKCNPNPRMQPAEKPGHGPGFPGLSGNLTGRTPVNTARQTAYLWIGPFTVLKTVPLFHPLAFSCKPTLPPITFPPI